jgi:SlyX protein
MNELETLAARIDGLETQCAHQERTIDDLNAALTRQWTEIDRLTQQVARLVDRLKEIESSAPAGPTNEAPPPHY